MTPAESEVLSDIARALDAAGHGGKAAVYAAGAEQLGCSVATLIKKLKAVRPAKPRKRRSDAGQHALTRDEALLIAATIEETRKLTGTGTVDVDVAVCTLRSNGKIVAGRVDADTGEFHALSTSAIRRAMEHHGVHPGQLAVATPATRLSSPHPNYCWQIDASVSRQFYLGDDGMQVMPQREFYRGKPQNFARINDRRLWRYAITDHASGYVEVFYVQGAESAANLLAALIHTMTVRAVGVMHGVPQRLMSDPGSAVTAATTRNFCDALGIELIVNQVGNSRAKGQVERAQYLIETTFEAPLKLRKPVTSLAEINELAAVWSRAFNATRIHTRTGMTRRDGWLRITSDQLQLAPPVEVLQVLPTSTPKPCTVRDYRIKFRGAVYDVSGMPGVLNNSKQLVGINPFDQRSVRVMLTGEDGRPAHYIAPELGVDDWGFDSNAARIDGGFHGVPDSPVDAARKEIERLAMNVKTDAEAVAARKRKQLAFGGEIDPMKPMREAHVPVHVPRAGTESPIEAPDVISPTPRVPEIRPVYEAPRLNLAETARHLKRGVEARGGTWSPELYARMADRWPEGVTEEQLDACVLELMRPALRVAGGAA